MKMKNIWQSGFDRISALSLNKTGKNDRVSRFRKGNGSAEVATIAFVLPLAGRFQTLQRFLKNYESVCLRHPETQTQLLVVLFDDSSTYLPSFYHELDRLKKTYRTSEINYTTVQGNFSRGVALNHAINSEHIQLNDILFFIDVDILFTQTTIERIRLNTILHQQVYLPIVFSEYAPNDSANSSWTANSHQFVGGDDLPMNLDYDRGYFRQFGYGICAIFKADILHPNISGFNDDITGWGLEDVKFLEKLVKIHQTPINSLLKGIEPNRQNSSTVPLPLSVFRAPDPTLVHIYHDIHCDKTLSESQYTMCLGTKANTLGSYKHIESIYLNNQKIVDFMRRT